MKYGAFKYGSWVYGKLKAATAFIRMRAQVLKCAALKYFHRPSFIISHNVGPAVTIRARTSQPVALKAEVCCG